MEVKAISIIQVTNPNTSNVPKTYLSVGQSSGVGTLYIKNPNGFSAQWGVQIGATGEEQSEIVLLNSSTPSGTSMVISGTTLYAHAADTPVFAIKYNQVIFEKSTTGTSVAASVISNGTVTITPDLTFTQFDDTSSASTDYYRTRFANSALAVQTSESDWFSPAGYSFYSLAKMTERVKDKLWSSGYIQDDSMIKNWVNEWRDEMANAVTSVNEDYALGSTLIGFGTNGLGTISDATFTNPRRVQVTYNGGVNFYPATNMRVTAPFPGETFVTTQPYYNLIGNNVLQVYPGQANGSASIIYYQFGTTMVNDTDELPIPMRSYTKSFIDYSLAQALFKDNKINEYDRMVGQATTAKNDFVSKISKRDKSGPTYIVQTETLTGEDGNL